MIAFTPLPFGGFSDPISSWSHLVAAVISLFAAIFLYFRGRGNTPRLTSLFIYSLALVFLFSMSGVFHLLERGTIAREVLKRLDHAGIWLLIAATFVPIHAILFRGRWRWAILLGVCSVAITGMVLELVFFGTFSSTMLIILFLGLGWSGVLSVYAFRTRYRHHSLWLLVGGGIMYSLGAGIEFSNRIVLIDGIIGPHEIFHLCVVAAAALHWSFIYRWASHPVDDFILFHVSVFSDRVVATAIDEHLVVHGLNVEDIKVKIVAAVANKYHSTITPKIRLRYSQEEDLN